MLTLFTIPKPFQGRIATIQRKAIQSWMLLRPACEIILFGDDDGTAETAAEFGVRHIPGVACNEYGTPLVSDIFEKAQRLAAYNLLSYVNADIILMSDFMRAVERVVRDRRQFLMVGRRWDVDVKDLLDFGTRWEDWLRTYVSRNGELHPPTGTDYFVFTQGLWGGIPRFAIGRTAWDNWLLYRARSRRIPLIDATQVVMAVHQNHDYPHNPEGIEGVWKSPEAKRNLILAGGSSHIFTLQDATHLLTVDGLVLALDFEYLLRHLKTLPVIHHHVRLPVRLLLKVINLSRRMSTRLGLSLSAKKELQNGK